MWRRGARGNSCGFAQVNPPGKEVKHTGDASRTEGGASRTETVPQMKSRAGADPAAGQEPFSERSASNML